jgi:NAD(P)-dependent dehydrogenase (short-subunit alcohol dehydrogenase family)
MLERGTGKVINFSSAIGEIGSITQANCAAPHRHRHAGHHPGQGRGADTWPIAVDRLGKPEEIARVVWFLVFDESSYITLLIWAVNGGLDT